MESLISAALVFLAIHFLIAGTRLRDVIVGAIGERAYLGVFSAASIAAIIWLVRAYNLASASSENHVLYDLGPAVRDSGILVVPLAFFLAVQGLLLPNPTAVMQEATATKEGAVQGVLRITRHPFLWGVVIWAGFHTAASGDLASVILFGTFAILAFFGTFSIDAKRRRKLGQGWNAYAGATSNFPFAAVIARGKPLKLAEDFGWRFWVALGLLALALSFHAPLFGVSPFPAGWTPF